MDDQHYADLKSDHERFRNDHARMVESVSHLARRFSALVYPQGTDVFIGFVYAGAISLLMSRSPFVISHVQFLKAAVVVLPMLFFLAATWLSYCLIRTQLPAEEEYSPLQNMLKFSIELAAGFFLTACCVYLMCWAFPKVAEDVVTSGSRPIDPCLKAAGAFGVFGLLSWLWNLVALKVMRELSLSDLIGATLQGRVRHLKSLETYAAGYVKWVADRDRTLTDRIQELAGKHNISDRDKTGLAFKILGWRCAKGLFDGGISWLGQLIVFHVAWSNLLAGIVLLIHTAIDRPDSGILTMLGLRPAVTSALLPGGLLLAGLVLFCVRRVPSVLPATAVTGAFLWGYLALTPFAMILVLAVEQLISIAVVQYHLVRRNDAKGPPAGAVT